MRFAIGSIGEHTRTREWSLLGLKNVRVDYTLDASRCGPSGPSSQALAQSQSQSGPRQPPVLSGSSGSLASSRLNFSVRAPPAAFAGRWVCVADEDSAHSNEVGFRIYGLLCAINALNSNVRVRVYDLMKGLLCWMINGDEGKFCPHKMFILGVGLLICQNWDLSQFL